MQHFCFVPMQAVCVHAGAGMPLTETGSQTSEHLAIDWRGDPKSKTRSQATLCSTEQAPRSLNLCCQSLLSDGIRRPFYGRTPNPLATAQKPTVARPGMDARAAMCWGVGRDGMVCTGLRTFTMCRIGFPRGACGETPPGDLGAGAQCSSHLGRVHRTCG